MRSIVLVIHNVRSAHNVGSMLRTADGFGAKHVYLTGYSPYPLKPGDSRLPHNAKRAHQQIHKTALGAEKTVRWNRQKDINTLLVKLEKDGYRLAALEQTAKATDLPSFYYSEPIALIVGSEIGGISDDLLQKIPLHLQIPMEGAKESFNVAVAAAIALYHLRFRA